MTLEYSPFLPLTKRHGMNERDRTHPYLWRHHPREGVRYFTNACRSPRRHTAVRAAPSAGGLTGRGTPSRRETLLAQVVVRANFAFVARTPQRGLLTTVAHNAKVHLAAYGTKHRFIETALELESWKASFKAL